ncbi:dynein regulatory complex protein 8 isoform X2 [Leopardus geoffroyi]|uniref:dynein regulatory complex protein 8 isoform X2 n=1 Tax=Leopardus geoffroyi TaxID=46844 RepID=UPI001E2643F8|nr:dynein regulatory complex protein 8 isoform X2 [Leopardus geoffroyi]
MADAKEREGPDITVAEFHKKIKDAFEVFDHEANNTVDVREIGTIIRSLGCCPSEGELHDLIAELHLETSSILLPSTPPSASWLPRGLSASCFLYVESRLCWLCLSTFYSPFINQLQCDFLMSAFPDLTYNCPLLYALIDPFSFTSLCL